MTMNVVSAWRWLRKIWHGGLTPLTSSTWSVFTYGKLAEQPSWCPRCQKSSGEERWMMQEVILQLSLQGYQLNHPPLLFATFLTMWTPRMLKIARQDYPYEETLYVELVEADTWILHIHLQANTTFFVMTFYRANYESTPIRYVPNLSNFRTSSNAFLHVRHSKVPTVFFPRTSTKIKESEIVPFFIGDFFVLRAYPIFFGTTSFDVDWSRIDFCE